MQVDYLILADAATVAQGKLYIHGAGWDRITALTFPVTVPSLGVALRLRSPWSDTNKTHRVELDVLDSGANSMLPAGALGGGVTFGRPAGIEVGSDQVMPLAFTLAGLTFQSPDQCAVVVRIDGLEAVRSPFTLAGEVSSGA